MVADALMLILDAVAMVVVYAAAVATFVILFDRSMNVEGEWIWQTIARLRREHKRLYPKDKP